MSSRREFPRKVRRAIIDRANGKCEKCEARIVPSRRLDVMGKRFGKLVAVEEMPRERGMRKWRLECDCGGEVISLQKAFCSGGTMRSCGCDNRQINHGLSKRREYRAWHNMRSRCTNPNTPHWEDYGGRGIRVCERWLNSFETFFKDVGPRPTPRHSLDRIEVDGDYEPGNVRWAVPEVQGRNKRKNRIVVIDGSEMTLAEAVERAPVPYNTVLYRIKRGWSVEDAITRPAKKGVRPHAA